MSHLATTFESQAKKSTIADRHACTAVGHAWMFLLASDFEHFTKVSCSTKCRARWQNTHFSRRTCDYYSRTLVRWAKFLVASILGQPKSKYIYTRIRHIRLTTRAFNQNVFIRRRIEARRLYQFVVPPLSLSRGIMSSMRSRPGLS